MEQYVTRVIVDADGISHNMLEAQFSTKGRASGRMWYLCTICGWYYPEDKVRLRGGQAFCIPHRCYESMDSNRQAGSL